MEESKSMVELKSEGEALMCAGQACTKNYRVINENNCEMTTFPQEQVMKGSSNVGFDSWNVNIMDPDGIYDPNDIDVWYYKEPTISRVSSSFAYMNENKAVVMTTNFYWGESNNFQTFRKYGNLTCRFTSVSDPTARTQITEAIMEKNPIGQFDKTSLPD